MPAPDELSAELQEEYRRERQKELTRARKRHTNELARQLKEEAKARARKLREQNRIRALQHLKARAKAFLFGLMTGLGLVLASFIIGVGFLGMMCLLWVFRQLGIEERTSGQWAFFVYCAAVVLGCGIVFAARFWKDFVQTNTTDAIPSLTPEDIEERDRQKREAEEQERQRKLAEETQKKLEEERIARKRWHEYYSRADLTAIDSMTGAEFEDFLCSLFRELGYVNVRKTPRDADQGADIICELHEAADSVLKICVQAKRQSANVGNKVVRETYGAIAIYACDEGLVVTNSQFTRPARKGAKQLNRGKGREIVRLCDREWLAARIRECFPREIPEFDGAVYEHKVKPLYDRGAPYRRRHYRL